MFYYKVFGLLLHRTEVSTQEFKVVSVCPTLQKNNTELYHDTAMGTYFPCSFAEGANQMRLRRRPSEFDTGLRARSPFAIHCYGQQFTRAGVKGLEVFLVYRAAITATHPYLCVHLLRWYSHVNTGGQVR